VRSRNGCAAPSAADGSAGSPALGPARRPAGCPHPSRWHRRTRTRTSSGGYVRHSSRGGGGRRVGGLQLHSVNAPRVGRAARALPQTRKPPSSTHIVRLRKRSKEVRPRLGAGKQAVEVRERFTSPQHAVLPARSRRPQHRAQDANADQEHSRGRGRVRCVPVAMGWRAQVAQRRRYSVHLAPGAPYGVHPGTPADSRFRSPGHLGLSGGLQSCGAHQTSPVSSCTRRRAWVPVNARPRSV
jgi:hypothetical protein